MLEETPLTDTARVSRFIFTSSHIAGGRPKPGAFLPTFDNGFDRWETSVCSLDGCSDVRVWSLARSSRPDANLKARVDFPVGLATSNQLGCVTSPMPDFEEHAVLLEWPEEKEDRKVITVALAKGCPAVLNPPAAVA